MRNILLILLLAFSWIEAIGENKKVEAIRKKYFSSYNYSQGLEAQSPEESMEFFAKELKENPKNPYANYNMAYLLCEGEYYDSAAIYLSKAFDYIPKVDKKFKSDCYVQRGLINLSLKDTSKAIDDFALAIKTMSKNANPYYVRACVYYDQCKFDLSKKDLETYISLDSSDHNGYLWLGYIYAVNEDYEKAIELYTAALERYDYSICGYSNRARCYYFTKQYDKAINDVINTLSIDDDKYTCHTMLFLSDSVFSDMVEPLQLKAKQHPEDFYWYYYIALCYERKEDYKTAIKYYRKSLDIELYLGSLLRLIECYRKVGDYDKGIKYAEKAMETDSTDYTFVLENAYTLEFAGRLDEAIELYSKYIQKYPDYYYAYYRRGWVKEYNNDIEGAIEDYTTAIALNHDSDFSYLNRGYMYRKLGKNDLANADFEKCIVMDTVPKDYTVAHYAYFFLGQTEKAMAFMDSVLLVSPTENYYNAACLYSIMNDKEKALSYFKLALEGGFRRFDHISRDYMLDNIRNEVKFKLLR